MENNIQVGQHYFAWIAGERTEVVVIAVREPNTVVNWTSADQSKRVFKVQPDTSGARNSRRYHVRQARQLRCIEDSNCSNP